MAPIICCGDLHDDRLGINSGWNVSAYFIHPGLHDVIRGKGPFVFSLSISSVPSSIIVRSAVNCVSNTASNPSIFKAVASLPVTDVPAGIPNSSPMAARTAGATCTTTCRLGSLIKSATFCHSSFSWIAPTGHILAHCPHDTHLDSASPRSNMGVTRASVPRYAKPSAATFCTSAHMFTQRPQSMHLSASRTNAGLDVSHSLCSFSL